MIKSLEEIVQESTCQKRITMLEIYDKDDNLLSRESNRCSPSGGYCHRLNTFQNKENYDEVSDCNWIHAEINAINHLKDKSQAYKSILYGHDFYCDNCENELKKIGIQVLEINKDGK